MKKTLALIFLFLFVKLTFAQELIQSIKFGEIDKAILLINSSKGLDEKDEDSNTVLHIAASTLNFDIVKRLIDVGVDVNSKNNYNETPLFFAVNNFLNGDSKPIIELLLKNGAQINLKGSNGRTLLEILCLAGFSDDPYGNQNRELAEFLISKGANINEIGSYGSSFLTNSVYANKTALIELALKYEPDINLCDSSGMSAFLYSCSSGNDTVARKLIEKNADVYRTNIYGENCLTIAGIYDHENIISLMLSKNISVNLSNIISGETALHKAAGSGYYDLVKFLIQNGADVNAIDNNQSTPLKAAEAGNYVEIIKLLKQNGAN